MEERKRRVVVWAANGFNAQGTASDEFSHKCLALAVERYRELQALEYEVNFLLPISEVRYPRSENLLWLVLFHEIVAAGVKIKDIRFTMMKTINGLEDGVAIARACKSYRALEIPVEVFATTELVARYLQLAYWAGARWSAWNWQVRYLFDVPDETPAIDPRDKLTYLLAYLITVAVGWNPVTWHLWYWFRKFTDRNRRKGFVVTVRKGGKKWNINRGSK